MPAKRSSSRFVTATEGGLPAKWPRKIVACNRCHSHKIKCSGQQPCTKCQQAGVGDECEYEPRDRKVTVSQSYIEQLLAENQSLREQAPPHTNAREGEERGPPQAQEDIADNDQSSRNPLIEDRAWFQSFSSALFPIFVGEAACTAFATRFRRFLTGDNAVAHIPRTQYVDEAVLLGSCKTEVTWPDLPQAQLLVKVAFNQVSQIYHMMLRKSTLAALKNVYRIGRFDCPVTTCKFFALFAFGEVYSIRSGPGSGQNFPGVPYYSRALSLIQILPERPSVTHIESLLLLSLFSYFLNRRHYAIILVGNAMRLGLTIGLNHNIPESQVTDPLERQHRVRIWWTIYTFERLWGSKMGIPMSILDEDVHVDMPSDISSLQACDDEFSDTAYMVASINLARIVGETVTKIYGRKKYKETFLQRVQQVLKALKTWVETLPEQIKLNSKDSSLTPKHIVSLHLSFNQCVILATRPTLLHVLTEIRKSENGITNDSDRSTVSQAALALAEACIHAAQHSHSLIIERWINGCLPMFDYFNAHYLFSSATVLVISSIISSETASRDIEAFDTASQVLRFLSGNGNFAAMEFSKNLEEIKRCLKSYWGTRDDLIPGSEAPSTITAPGSNFVAGSSPTFQSTAIGVSQATAEGAMNRSTRNAQGGFTTEMAFLEPTMQAFLEQSDFDLGILNQGEMSTSDANSLYFWTTPQWTG